MKKILFLVILSCAGVAWGQAAPKNLNYNNPAEVIITLAETINIIIDRYENNDAYVASLNEHQQTVFRYLYALAIEAKPEIANMSHSERLLILGMIQGIMQAVVALDPAFWD